MARNKNPPPEKKKGGRDPNPPSKRAREDAQRDMRREGFVKKKCPPHVPDRTYTRIGFQNYYRDKCKECGCGLGEGWE